MTDQATPDPVEGGAPPLPGFPNLAECGIKFLTDGTIVPGCEVNLVFVDENKDGIPDFSICTIRTVIPPKDYT